MRPSRRRNTLTLRRRGKFTYDTFGESHCGLDEKQTIKYEVTAVCSAARDKLDERCFLFEQRSIDEFFQSLDILSESCEELARLCAKQIKKLIMEENPDCVIYELHVQLKAKPYLADMTYSWYK